MIEIKWTGKSIIADEKQLDSYEQLLDIKLPNDYKTCLMIEHGRSPMSPLIDVDGIQKVFGELLSFDKNETGNIFQAIEWLKDRLPKGVYPFAEDPGGNYFCFDFESEKKQLRIVFFNCELAFDEFDYEDGDEYPLDELQRDAVFFISNSFEELLELLYTE